MDFLQTEQRLVYTSKDYESIYVFFNDEYRIEYAELFVLCAIIGFKTNSRKALSENGREFRSNYIKSGNRSSLYTILLSNKATPFVIDDFLVKEKYKDMVKVLEEYSEGGMNEIIEKVFKSKYHKGNLDPVYKHYLRDVMQYVRDIVN